MKRLFTNRKGQNTVEYLLILAVVVGVVLIVGGLLRSKLPDITKFVAKTISDATESMSRDGGN